MLKSLYQNKLLFKPVVKGRPLCCFSWTYLRGYALRKAPRIRPFLPGFRNKNHSDPGFKTNFPTFIVAAMLGVNAIVSAQSAELAPEDNNADTAVSLNVAETNPGAASSITETKDMGVLGKTDHTSLDHAGDGIGTSPHKSGFGIAGGPIPGIISLDIRPIRELTKSSKTLKDRSFRNLSSSNFESFATMGGMGYVGLGNGLRLGGGATGGSRYFVSDPYAGDSIASLNVSVHYGGFLIEKAFVLNRFNFLSGTQIGGGSMTTTIHRTVESGSFIFNPSCSKNRGESKTANFFLLEFHGGFTFSLAPFLHLGTEASLPVFYSQEGFEASTNAFISMNPAIQVRLVFGNLG
jgi:hypothetical protein